MIYLTQSLHSFHNSMESHGHHKTLGLLTNFAHLCIHTLGDSESARFASDLLGQRRETFISPSSPRTEDPWDRLMGLSNMSVSMSESYQPVLQPSAFMTGLRCGGPDNGHLVDGIVMRAGQPFRNGERYQLVSFSQR